MTRFVSLAFVRAFPAEKERKNHDKADSQLKPATSFPNGETRYRTGTAMLVLHTAKHESMAESPTELSDEPLFDPKCVWMATTGVRNMEIHAPKLVALERVEIDVMVYGHDVGPAPDQEQYGLVLWSDHFQRGRREPNCRGARIRGKLSIVHT